MTLFSFPHLLRIVLSAAALIRISVQDVRFRRIPGRPLVLFAASSLLRLFSDAGVLSVSGTADLLLPEELFPVLSDMLTGGAGTFLFLLIVTRLADRFLHAETLGGGDIKLAAAFGLHLGLSFALLLLLSASVLALPEALIRRRRGERGFPFAPYLSAAGVVFLLLTA